MQGDWRAWLGRLAADIDDDAPGYSEKYLKAFEGFKVLAVAVEDVLRSNVPAWCPVCNVAPGEEHFMSCSLNEAEELLRGVADGPT